MATVRWIGNAADITQVDLITVANTWAEDDTVTITINGNDIVCTVGSTATTTAVATLIAAAINASASAADAATGDYNIGGQEIPEFTEISATSSAGVVTVTANTAGKPFTMSVTESTAGSGTATESTSVAATGKHFWSNADNWSGGAVPTSSDAVWFDSGDVDCKYGLPAGSLEPTAFEVTMSYTGKIGLAEINKDSGNSSTYYREYRPRFVHFDDAAGNSAAVVKIGSGVGAGSPLINIRWEDTLDAYITIFNTGSAQTGVSEYPLNVRGTPAGDGWNVNAIKGQFSLGLRDDEATGIDTLTVGYLTQQATDVTCYVGAGSSVNGQITIDGGVIGIHNPSTTTGSSLLEVKAGTVTLTAEGGWGEFRVLGGILDVYSNSGSSVTNVYVSGGELRTIRGAGFTFSNASVYAGATYKDPLKVNTLTNGIDLVNCGIGDVSLDLGSNMTLTRSAI